MTITGTNFEQSGVPDVANLQVGSVELGSAPFTVDSPTQITADLPAASSFVPPNDQTDGAGEYQVTVTLTDGETSAVNMNTGFTFVDDNGSSQALPTVTGVHTFAGAEAGGNTVLVYGSGFTGATSVTFGGVAASTFTVNPSGTQISVTVPAYQDNVTTCDESGGSFGETATNDICQTQVQVTTPNGMSHEESIDPLYEGSVTFSDVGVIEVPPGDEAAPAATEYDYVPTPTITSISTTNGPGSLASENGDALVTIDGTGLNLSALEWVNFGDPTQAASQQFFSIVSDTGKEIQVVAPALANTTIGTTNVPVSVMTAAGLSNQVNATYAGVPTVTSVMATAGPTSGQPAGPDTGGTPIEIDGSGFANQATMVTFADVASQFSFGTQFNLDGQQRHQADDAHGRAEPGVRRHPGVHRHRLLAAELARVTTRPTSSSSSRRATRRSTPSPPTPVRRRAEPRSRSRVRTSAASPRSRSAAWTPRMRPTSRRCSTAARRARSR